MTPSDAVILDYRDPADDAKAQVGVRRLLSEAFGWLLLLAIVAAAPAGGVAALFVLARLLK